MIVHHFIEIPRAAWLGAIYFLSEIALLVTRHSNSSGKSKDRYSLWLLWIVIFIGIFAGLWAASACHFADLPHRAALNVIGILIFAAGVILRWWSIVVLGKFFTVDVAISEQHRVIDYGPYRLMRHPSYTGALVAFIGFGLCLCNWMSILLLMVPITIAFLWRIRIEERALVAALGDDYLAYAARTRRLIPFLL